MNPPVLLTLILLLVSCGCAQAQQTKVKQSAKSGPNVSSAAKPTPTAPSKPAAEPVLDRAAANLRKGLYKSVIADCTKYIKTKPNCAEAYLLRAEARLLDNQRDDAIRDAAEASRLIPNKMAPYFIEIQTLLMAHSQETGIAECTYMIPDAPQPAALFLARGLLHVLAGNSRAALNDFDTGLSHRPPRPLETWLLGAKFGAYKSRHEEDQAWEYLDESKSMCAQLLKEHPNDLAVLFLRGAISDFSGTQANPSDFSLILKKNPGPMIKYYATHMLASEESDKGHYERAVALLQQNTRLWPQHPNSHLLLAACQAKLGNHKAVAEEIGKLQIINPYFAVTYGQRAGYYGALGKIPQVTLPDFASIAASQSAPPNKTRKRRPQSKSKHR